jgi:hypothetical protein
VAQIVVWLNAAANAVGRVVLAPVGVLPGWLSATCVAAATGVLLLLVYKYTSHQRAIKRVRNDIKANLLALKLFKDSAAVAVGSQGRILFGAARLMGLAIVPILVMTVPVCLLLAQMSLWYRARPLHVGEEAVITLQLNGDRETHFPDVRLQPGDAVEVTTGPVRLESNRWVCWEVKARAAGYHRLVFQVDGEAIDKELAVGDGYMRVSTTRPGWSWLDVMEHPAERPFGPESPVRAIAVDYPERSSWKFLGIEGWLCFWFAVSMVAGLCFSKVFNVNI